MIHCTRNCEAQVGLENGEPARRAQLLKLVGRGSREQVNISSIGFLVRLSIAVNICSLVYRVCRCEPVRLKTFIDEGQRVTRTKARKQTTGRRQEAVGAKARNAEGIDAQHWAYANLILGHKT